MIKRILHSERGQALVWVAISMVALLACVALATDYGRLLGERRRMQNAADAGALAGAWEICFGTPGQALITAEEYAVDRNFAQTAAATHPDGETWKVNVVASETVNMLIARVIGVPTVDVAAEAEAVCGGVRSLCGVWPITFQEQRWNDMPQCPDNDNVPFVVWNDAAFEETEPKYTDPVTGHDYYICDVCDCENIPEWGAPDTNYFLIAPGQRGWVNLPRPEPPFTDELACTDNCGAIQSVCVIDSEGAYTGLLEMPEPGEPLCLPSQPGVATTILHAVERNLDEEVNLLIWDDACPADDPVLGTCPGSPAYNVVKTGCAVAKDVLSADLPLKAEFSSIPGSASWCPKNVKAILMEKRCNCESECGSANGGGPPAPGEVRAVSLTK